jgi:transposase
LLSISKRGNVYLRILLIQGVRAVLNAKLRFTTEDQRARKDYSKFTEWMFSLSERRIHNIAVVAVANKLARVVFAVLSNDYNEYKVYS